jgi:heme/copper-type cytochrome/quinol oxidase subunit 3
MSAQAAEWAMACGGRGGWGCVRVSMTALVPILSRPCPTTSAGHAAPPYPQDVLDLPVLATSALLSSGITITLAVRALRARARRLQPLVGAYCIALGAFFLSATAMNGTG